ncbi:MULTISPECIES: hypothetical protein [Bacillus]|nr:hypothetical protein [Bacillus safensis]
MMEPSLLALHRIPSDGGAANFSRYREGCMIPAKVHLATDE